MNTRMYGTASRLVRRLLIFGWAALLVGAMGAEADPVKTLVEDTLYRADGSAAHGKVTIRWNGFSTAAGEAVAAGEMTVSMDANGGIAIPLIPNTGSTPSGTYYKVVVKLDDGTTSEELWVVPAAAKTTVAAIRAKVVPQAVAAQFVSRDYVDSALSKLTTLQVNADWNSISGASQVLNKPLLSAVATSGSYNDLSNKPAVADLSVPGPIGGTTPAPVNGTTGSFLSTVKAGATVLLADGSWVINVKAFGAKCDSVTDDHTAIQGALDYAFANGGTLLFPVGTCLTSTLHYRGENMMGLGATVSYVRGKPGQDVFAQTDPALDSGYQATRQFATIKDFTIQVDSTVNATASFPNRLAYPDAGVAGIASPRTWNIGNCGFAFPMSDGAHGAALLNHLRMNRVHITNWAGLSQSNGSCGIFLQAPDYDAAYEDVIVQQTQFGYIQAPPVLNQTVYEWAPDGNRYTHMSFFNLVPFVAYNGEHVHIAEMQMYSGTVGAQSIYILGFTSKNRGQPYSWVIDDLYAETNSATTGMIGRITGSQHVANSGNWKQAYGPSYIEWDASNSMLNQVGILNDGTNPVLKVTGSVNNIRILAHANTNVSTDTGGGNRIEVGGVDGSILKRSFVTNTARHPAYMVNSDSVVSGNVASYYRNATDLMLFPNEITFNGSAATMTLDPTVAMSGQYATIASPGGTFFSLVDGTQSLIVGQRVPKAKVRIYVYGQTGVAASQSWFVKDVTTSSNFPSASLNFTTSWGVQYFDTDLSGASLGDVLQIQANSTSPNTTVSVGWIAIRPWADDVLVNGTVFANAISIPAGGWVVQDTFAAGTPAEPFNSLNGMFLKPDTYTGGSVGSSTVTTDATVPISGKYRSWSAPGGWYFQAANGAPISVGTTVPKTKVRTYLETRAPGGAGTQNCYLNDITTSTQLPYTTVNIGTGWTLVYWDTDLSVIALGDTLQPTCNNPSSGSAVDVAWVQFTPWQDSENVVGPVNAGAYQVNGSALGFSNLGGTLGMAQIPTGGNSIKFLRGDGAWATPASSGIFPVQVASVAPTTYSGTTGVGVTTLYTPAAAGLFRICGFLDMTVAASAGTFQIKYGYTSDGHSFSTGNILTNTVGPGQWASTASPSNNANGNACTVFYADTATAVQWQVAASGVTGTPTVRYAVTLEQLE